MPLVSTCVEGPRVRKRQVEPVTTELPILLAGPILRRCDREEIAVWFATSLDPQQIVMQLTSLSPDGGSQPLGEVDESTTTMRIGARLWVTLHRCRLAHGKLLPVENYIGYEVLARATTVAPISVVDAVPGGRRTICYRSLPRPAFFLPGHAREALTFAFGSCRKLNGYGLDMFEGLDEQLQNGLFPLVRRPSVLALLGDQIYADEVPDPLLEHLHDLLPHVIGYFEQVPALGPSQTAPGKRRAAIPSTQFSTEDGTSHVFTFGEYCLLYLLYWSESLWPIRFKGDSNAVAAMESARLSLPAVRRVLANCPTYMMFDDHEITDDWNLDRVWRKRVLDSASGRRIVANGLAAYTVFQAWGNAPRDFPPSVVQSIHDYATWLIGTDGRRSRDAEQRFERAMWTCDRWSFATPTSPPIVFMDTRTQRDFSTEEFPRLVSEAELRRVAEIAASHGFKKGMPLLLGIAAPVYGVPTIEDMQERLHRYKWDRENWMTNRWSYIKLLTFLVEEMEVSHCVFLGGDLHYAYNLEVGYTQTRPHRGVATVFGSGEARELRIHQLTSSSVKNSPPGRATTLLRGAPRVGVGLATDFQGEDRAAVWHGPGGGDPFGPTIAGPMRSSLLTTDDPLFVERHRWIRPRGSANHIVADSNISLVTYWPKLKRTEHVLITGRRSAHGPSFRLHASVLR